MKQSEKKSMKPAIIESILLWMVMFIGFISLFFMILDYAVVLRTKDNLKSLSDYGARMVALDRDEAVIIAGLNRIRIGNIAVITSTSLNCVEDTSAGNYQVIFDSQTTFANSVFTVAGTNNLRARTSVFNEITSNQITCTLDLVTN